MIAQPSRPRLWVILFLLHWLREEVQLSVIRETVGRTRAVDFGLFKTTFLPWKDCDGCTVLQLTLWNTVQLVNVLSWFWNTMTLLMLWWVRPVLRLILVCSFFLYPFVKWNACASEGFILFCFLFIFIFYICCVIKCSRCVLKVFQMSLVSADGYAVPVCARARAHVCAVSYTHLTLPTRSTV